MSESLENWKTIPKTRDFIVGTFFLLLLFLVLFVEETILSGEQFLFGLFFLLLLGGFFMYIFSPPLVELIRAHITSVRRCIFPPLSAFVIFAIYRIIVPTSTSPLVTLTQIFAGFFFIFTPTLLYLSFREQTKNGLSYIDVFAGLWVWFPIEFGIVDDFIGRVELGAIPFDTLLVLFAFIYALIFVRHHDMGLTFSISTEDLINASKAYVIIMPIIIPLGILTYFLAPPAVIWENFLTLVANAPESLVDIILTFLLMFLGTALIEELFFRGFIFNLLEEKFEKGQFSSTWTFVGILGLTGLIIVTPWVDDILQILCQWIPFLTPLQNIIGSLAEPLGDSEGLAWPLVQSVPLEFLYLIVAIILGIAGFLLTVKTKDPVIAALVLSSILFGWAHFEDVRYIFFASIAGFAYGWTYWKTQKIVPAALVHMTVNSVWGLLFTF